MTQPGASKWSLEFGHPDCVEGKDGPELRATFWSEGTGEASSFVMKREAAGTVLAMEFPPSRIASGLMAMVESALEGVAEPAVGGSLPGDERLVLRRNIPRGEEGEVSKRVAEVLGDGWEQPLVRLLTSEPARHQERRAVTWYGIPRVQIPWYPLIDPGTCDGCGKCVDFCPHDVLRLSGEPPRAEVTRPFDCQVGCASCSSQCPQVAIQFPPREMLREIQQAWRSA